MTDFPSFYDPANVEKIYDVDFQRVYQAGLDAEQSSAEQDTPRVLLFLIDAQIDFVFPAPTGRLTVPNALADTRRTVEFIYRNVGSLTKIAASLDTHTPNQIFYPSWWINDAGEHPAPMTTITSTDVENGTWRPTQEPAWSIDYVKQLESSGKKQLLIWPYHCLQGTLGHALVPAVSEAMMYHAGARNAQPLYLPKGEIARTEYYSAVEPEVKDTAHPAGTLRTEFLDTLAAYDLIYIAGQARSHCVLETINSMLRYFDPSTVEKLRLIDDATSSISGFEEATEQRIDEFQQQGVRLVKAADPIA